ncbi:MAG TPA: 30S ribosomal protein S21 [Nitrososphaera sp.]|nr:30S ribosomal protein S21 [Nitrososphaera sp.]
MRFQEGELLENALYRFKSKVQQENIVKEVKRHSFYLKPGERRRVKQALARKTEPQKSPQRAGLIYEKPGCRCAAWIQGLNFFSSPL